MQQANNLKGTPLNRRALAVPLTLALVAGSVTPAAFAATVGPNDRQSMLFAPNGSCMLKLNKQETETYTAWLNLKTQAVYANAAVKGFEAVYPGVEKLALEFQDEPTLAALVDARVNNAYAVQAEAGETHKETEAAYAKRFQQLGMEPEVAKHFVGELTQAAIAKAEPKLQVGETLERPLTALSGYDADRVRGKRVNRKDFEDAAWASFLAKGDMPSSAASKFRRVFLAADDVQLAVGATTAYLETDAQARAACSDGGNQQVKYPSSLEELRAWNRDSGFAGGSFGGVLSDGSSADDGSLSPVAIAGIVIGALAVLGMVAAAAAPILGVQLPALPAMPAPVLNRFTWA